LLYKRRRLLYDQSHHVQGLLLAAWGRQQCSCHHSRYVQSTMGRHTAQMFHYLLSGRGFVYISWPVMQCRCRHMQQLA
jgi:hypothetical protein